MNFTPVERTSTVSTPDMNRFESPSMQPVDVLVKAVPPPPRADILAQFYADRPRHRGGSVESRRECAQLAAHHQWQQARETCPKKRELRDVEFMASRLADREPQVGDCLPLSHGVFTVTATFVREGAYVACLEDVSKRLAPKVLCRGTAMRWNATQNWQSGLNNVVPEMASRGVQAVWPDLLCHFQRIGATSVEVLGKSMGGACAQQIAILFEVVARIPVVKLTTLCSVGAGERVNALFKEQVLAHRHEPFRILVVRAGGRPDGTGADCIPFVGGEHLGMGTTEAQCDIEVCYIGRDGEIHPPQQGSVAQMATGFLASFPGAHSRQTTLAPFSVSSVQRSEVDRHLAMGTALEGTRMRLASWLSWSGLTAQVPSLEQFLTAAAPR
jgi:hypothetical protein